MSEDHLDELREVPVDVSVVLPLLNEEGSLPTLLEALTAQLTSQDVEYEIVVVDDGSTDRTWSIVTASSTTDRRVRGVSLTRNFGKDAAIFAGLREARGAAVIVMDGDGQHPVSLLPELIHRWRAGADVVEAVKQTRVDQPLRVRLGARAFNRMFSHLTDVDLTNATDLRLLSRSAVEALLLLPERAVFFRGTSTWIGFERERVEFAVEPRILGRSRFSLRSLSRFAIRSLTAFTAAPLHIVTVLGLAFGVFAVLLGFQTLGVWLAGESVEGFTTVILLILILGTAILFGLGIIGSYLARIHDEVKARPRYLIARRTEDRAEEL